LNVNPDVVGQTSFTFDTGVGSATVNFATGRRAAYSLNGGCPVLSDYDALNATAATSARVYRYREPNNQTLGGGAIVMNTNAAEDWNTILQSHAWFDMRDLYRTAPSTPTAQEDLMRVITDAVLPSACSALGTPNPTDTDQPPAVAVPLRTVLYPNVPNPFNPVTRIRFDLARDGRVRLAVYDVAGRMVRTLVDKELQAGPNHEVVWNGLDDAGQRVSTGVYFYRLDAGDDTMTKKMVVMK